MAINEKISVVTVTFNNAENLKKTLQSIWDCPTKPLIIIVIDGYSEDNTLLIIEQFSKKLPIEFISEVDGGIYDAMNKGRRLAKTGLIHYLNAGDTISGDPYAEIQGPCLMPVCVKDETTGEFWFDYLKLRNFGYCHQGIIFPKDHPPYDCLYDLAADFKMICQVFPDGMNMLSCVKTGFVTYALGGVSSMRTSEGVKQMIVIAKEQLNFFNYIIISVFLYCKNLLPRSFRRFFATIRYKRIGKLS